MAQSPLFGKSFDRQSQYRDRLAAQLLAEGSDSSPIQHPLQGAARLAQALAGGLIGMKQDQRYAEREKQSSEAMANLFAPTQQFTPSAAGAGPRPGAQMQTAQPTLAELAQRAAAHPSTAHLAPQFQMQDIAARQAAEQRGTWKPAEQNGLKGQVNSATGEFKPDPMPRASNTPRFSFQNVNGRLVGIDQSDPTKRVDIGPYGSPETAKPQGPAPAFPGNGVEAQHYNNVLTLEPSDPRYAVSFNALYGPRVVERDGVPVRIEPPIPQGIRPPTFGQQPPAPAAQPPAPGIPPQATPPGASPQQLPPVGVPNDAQPGAAVRTELPGGGAVTRVTPPPTMTREERAKFDNSISNAAQISNALDDYARAFEGAGLGDRARSALGFSTNLNTAFNGAALLAKGEELFNLGVLNGPDLDIIRRTLPDPSTGRGAFASGEDARRASDQVRRMLQDRLSAFMRQKGVDPIDIAAYGRSLRQNEPKPPLGNGEVADANDPLGLR